MVISGVLTVALLAFFQRYAKDQKTKNCILKFFAIITVAIHYSNLWVDYFVSGGNATIENNHILPVYPCNVVMWMLLIAACLQNKKSLAFQILGEFCFWGGTVCSVVGVVLNVNFGNTPTLADYDILKGLLSHSTMLVGCLYMKVGGYIRIRVFNAVSVLCGLGSFVVCGRFVNSLYKRFGMTPPDGMMLVKNPYTNTSIIVIGVWVVLLLFCGLALWEMRLPEEERWYKKLKMRNWL